MNGFLVVATGHAGVGGRSGAQAGARGFVGGSSLKGKTPYALTGLGNEYERSSPNFKSKDPIVSQKSARNISTPQIVFILTLIMSLGFAGYYFVQFYPFMCSKESKYDVMSRASVTPTHSREFEYESTSSATKSTNASIAYEHDV